MDNVIIGTNTVEEAIKNYKEAKILFQDAKMNLREFTSNSKEFNQKIPAEDRNTTEETKYWELNGTLTRMK